MNGMHTLAIKFTDRMFSLSQKTALVIVCHSGCTGFYLPNDYSETEFQRERSGHWVKGKSAVYSKPGDVIALGMDGLDTQKQIARSWS